MITKNAPRNLSTPQKYQNLCRPPEIRHTKKPLSESGNVALKIQKTLHFVLVLDQANCRMQIKTKH